MTFLMLEKIEDGPEVVIFEAESLEGILGKLQADLLSRVDESEGEAAANFKLRAYRVVIVVSVGGLAVEPDGKREVRTTLSVK